MDRAHDPHPHSAFLETADGKRWAGARASMRVVEAPPAATGTMIGLVAMAAIGLVLVAHTAVALQPRVAAVRVGTPAEIQAADTPARPEAPLPEAVGPDPEVTANGYTVQPWRWPEALTVSRRVTLLASPADANAAGRGVVQEGRAIRVIGLVAVTANEAWLQVRTDNGGVAYVDAEDVMPLPAFRDRQRTEAARAAAEAQAEAAAAQLDQAFGTIVDLGVPPPETAEPSPAPAVPGELY